MNKKNNISLKIDNDLFTQIDLDFVDEKFEQNLPLLLQYGKYIEIDKKLAKLNLELVSSLNEKQRELLRKYQNLSLDATSYQNCLAYYIGLKTKNEVEKLK